MRPRAAFIVTFVAILAVITAVYIAGFWVGHQDGYDQGRADVCAELAAAGVGIGGASSIGPDGETERTGC